MWMKLHKRSVIYYYNEIRYNPVTHRVAGIYGLVIGHSERKPHYGNNGVQDEGEKHVFVEGNSLAAKTPERETQTDRGKRCLRLLYIFKG